MKQIREKFQNNKALIPYVTAGDPDIETTIDLVKILEESGADIVELGVPFSDPLADGPTIQAAGQRALANNITLARIIEMMGRIREETSIPILLMGYYNSFYNYLQHNSFAKIKEAGVNGLIIPDLPFDEDYDFYEKLRYQGLAGIHLVSPNTREARLRQIAENSFTFIYCVALLGVTGARDEAYSGLAEYISRVRNYTDLPLGLGFGIDGPEKAAAVGRYVDGVIIGSALIEIINKNSSQPRRLRKKVGDFITEVKKTLMNI